MNGDLLGQRRRYTPVFFSGAMLVSGIAAVSIVACALGLLPDPIAVGAMALAILAVLAWLIVSRPLFSCAGERESLTPETIIREAQSAYEHLATQRAGDQPVKLTSQQMTTRQTHRDSGPSLLLFAARGPQNSDSCGTRREAQLR